METTRRTADDLLDVVRVLLLLQGSILVVSTIEALVFGAAFGASTSAVLTAAAAIATLVARVRARADRPRTRRVIYVIEGLIIATFGVDTVLAVLIAHGAPPPVAVLTRFILPVAVIALLGRASRPAAAALPSTIVAPEGV